MIICQLASTANRTVFMSRKGVVEHWLSFQCLNVSTHTVISTSLLGFKGGRCCFGCYFWLNEWLVGTSLPETPETGNARGTVLSPRSLSSQCNRTGSVLEAGAPRLFRPGSSRPAVPLSSSHTPLPPPSFPLPGHQQAESVRQVDLSPWQQTTFHLSDF